MWKISLTFRLRLCPLAMQVLLQPAKSFFFRDAGIRHAVIVVLQEVPFFLGCKVSVVGDPLVVRMRHKVHHILLQIGTGTADDIHFPLTDHLCK